MRNYINLIESAQTPLAERHLTPALKKQRERVKKALEREHPDWPEGKVYAIATTAAEKTIKEDKENSFFEEGNEENPCWDDYKMVGMKKKGGKKVPNCVPEEKLDEAKRKSMIVPKTPKKKSEKCVACNGTGHYDSKGSPKCQACNGKGIEECLEETMRAAIKEAFEASGLNKIVKTNWLDVPYSTDTHGQGNGLKNYPGIYLCRTGSNSVYGNRSGGFSSKEAAKAFAKEHNLGDDWKIVDQK